MPFHHKIDVAWKVMLVTTILSGIWWAAIIDSRTQDIPPMKLSIETLTVGMAKQNQKLDDIESLLTSKSLSQQ